MEEGLWDLCQANITQVDNYSPVLDDAWDEAVTDDEIDLEIEKVDHRVDVSAGLDQSVNVDDDDGTVATISLIDISYSFSYEIFDRFDLEGHVLVAPVIMLIDDLLYQIVLPAKTLEVAQDQSGLIIIATRIRMEEVTYPPGIVRPLSFKYFLKFAMCSIS